MKVILAQLKENSIGWMNGNAAGGYLKAMAYKEGLLDGSVSIEILNDDIVTSDNNHNIAKEIISRKPEILGLSLYSWNLMSSLFLAKKVKKKKPDIKIIVGGPEVAHDNIHLKNCSFIDIMVYGEGEKTFVNILKYFIYGKPKLGEIKGIFYRKDNNIKINPPTEPIKRLDSIPSPYILGYLKPKNDFMWIMVGRGCVNRCLYCSEWVSRKGKVSYFSTKRIREEILIAQQEKVKLVKLEIPTFNAHFKKMKEICEALKKINRNNFISFDVELRADYLDEKSIRILKQANIKRAEAGLETINLSTLERINRDINLNKFVKGIYLLKKAGIVCHINFLFGLPGETLQSLRESVIFLLKSKLYRMAKINFNVVAIGPGTCLRNQADKYGIKYQRRPLYRVIETNSINTKEFKKISCLHSFRDALTLLKRK